MDALALLCTLHAEGPATLRQLRESGVRNLADLERAEPETLSQTLDLSTAAARRFLREAAALSARVQEDTPAFEAGLPIDLETAPSTSPATDAPDEIDLLSKRDRRLVDRVLDRWRDEEASAPAPTGSPAPTRSGLEVGAIDGLTAEVCARLEQAGIDSLRALAEIDPLATASQAGLGFSTLRRLQYLAGRETAKRPIEPRISLADRPNFEIPGGAVRAWELPPEQVEESRPPSGGAHPGGGVDPGGGIDRGEGVGGPFAQD